MTQTKEDLTFQINNLIKANNNNEIMGVILNGLLRDMTNSLATSYFLFSRHDSVSGGRGKAVFGFLTLISNF